MGIAKRSITYKTDFDNEEVTNDFYFRLTEERIAAINLRGGIERLSITRNPAEVIDFFRTIVHEAVGERRGNSFVRTADFADWFVSSDAFNTMFMDFFKMEDPTDALWKFLQEIVPDGMLPDSPEEARDKMSQVDAETSGSRFA